MRAAREGDEEAFAALYRAHVGRVYAVCLRMTADRARAESLTQDAFVRCWRKLDTFRGDAAFGSWLYRLAINLVLNDRRSRSRRERREQAAEPDLGRHGRAGAGRTERLVDVERAVASLPDGAREALVLYAVEGYRYREVAELLGIAEGTVKAQIHRARQLLRERLEGARKEDG